MKKKIIIHIILLITLSIFLAYIPAQTEASTDFDQEMSLQLGTFGNEGSSPQGISLLDDRLHLDPPQDMQLEDMQLEVGGPLGTNINEIVRELRTIETNPCLTDKDKREYIITVLEEPLRIQDTEQISTDGTFIERPCYRHVFRFYDQTTTPDLSRINCASEQSAELHKIANTLEDNGAYSCKAVLVILSKGGTTMLYYYIGMIYRWGVSIVGIIAVLVIVLNGIRISASGGDPEAINKSKRMIIQSLAAIAVLILSGIILYTINPDFFVR